MLVDNLQTLKFANKVILSVFDYCRYLTRCD